MTTPNLGLSSTSQASGSMVTFLNWRLLQDADNPSSNMMKIDAWAGAVSGSLTEILEEKIHVVTGTGDGATFSAVETDILSYFEGLTINLTLDVNNTGVTTININGLGDKFLKKMIAGVRSSLSSGDLTVGSFNIFIYNSGEFVWANYQSTSIHSNTPGEIINISEKSTPVDADVTIIEDSVATNAKKRLSWANIKATLKTYFDTVYPATSNVFHKDGNAEFYNGFLTKEPPYVFNDVFLFEDSESAPIYQKKRTFWGKIVYSLKTYDLVDVFAPIAKGVTNGDSHNHLGGDGGQIAHSSVSGSGTNTHGEIDTFISTKGIGGGLASLNSGSLVEQNPANATSTPTASKIPIANSDGFLNAWLTHPPEVFRGATFTEEFRSLSNLPSGWAWATGSFITPPTITYYSSGIQCSGYTTITKSFMYKTPNAAQRSYYVMCPVYRLGIGSYVGWRIDDGTDNNYVEHVHAPQSDGSFGELKRTRVGGGTPVETLVKSYITPLPWITIYAFCNGTLWSDWYVDYYVQGGGVPFMSLTGGGTHWTWTPSRVGFIINIATASAPYLYVLLDAWTG